MQNLFDLPPWGKLCWLKIQCRELVNSTILSLIIWKHENKSNRAKATERHKVDTYCQKVS